MTKIKKELTIWTFILAGIIEVVSLFVIGAELLVPAGLIFGVVVSLICIFLLSISIERAVQRGKKALMPLGMLLRLVLYGVAFYLAIKFGGKTGGIGCAIGFFLPMGGLIVSQQIVPKIKHSGKK